jgi:site-specific recombinase XerD
VRAASDVARWQRSLADATLCHGPILCAIRRSFPSPFALLITETSRDHFFAHNGLRSYLAQRKKERCGDDERLWPGKWYRKAGEVLQRDLAAARATWLKNAEKPAERKRREQSDFLLDADAADQVVDFHSLRHGFITHLVMANVPPKVAQALARHSTITLTMDRYTHLGMGDLVDAVGTLNSIVS